MNIEEAINYLEENLKKWKADRPNLGNSDIVEEVDKDYRAIETLLTAYEKEKEERGRIGKLYYEANENCIKYEKELEKEKEKNKELERKIKIKETDIDIFMKKLNNAWVYNIREIIYPTPENPIPLEVQQSDMYKKLVKEVEE